MQYSAQSVPCIDKLKVKVVKEGPWPVQMILCLQEKKYAFPTQAWAECFRSSLGARICVAVIPSMKVSGEKLYAMWNAAGGQSRSGDSNSPKIVAHQEDWLRSLKRAWVSNQRE
jgi:hypothetical protein